MPPFPPSPDPSKSNALSAEGWQLWQKRQYSDALEKFEQAVKLNPDNTSAWNGLGWVQFNSGSPDEAEQAWQKCLALTPTHAAALNGIGQLALLQRQYDKAETYLLQAANANASAAWFGLARIYLLQGKYDQAEKWAQKLVSAEPKNEEGTRMLAAARARNVDPELRSQFEPPAPERPRQASWQPRRGHGGPTPGSPKTSDRVDTPSNGTPDTTIRGAVACPADGKPAASIKTPPSESLHVF